MINRVAILLTCFNRKEKTLQCLTRLRGQIGATRIRQQVYLVDDGSTDGTRNAVANDFPDVNIIHGNGTLFWNGGMRLAWSEALASKHDFYLWVNDDSMIYPDALCRILATYNELLENSLNPGAVLGTMVDPVGKQPTYGGRLRNSKFNPISCGPVLKPGEGPIRCDFVNGNFTLIPSISVGKIGILSDAYTHSIGDFDYGLRLQKAGLSCWIAPGTFGECARNSKSEGCTDSSLPIAERMGKMRNLGQLPPVNEWMHYVRLHGGHAWPWLWLRAWVRGRFPFIWAMIRSEKVSAP